MLAAGPEESGVITLLDSAGHFIEHWLDRAGGLLPFGPKRVSSAMIKSKAAFVSPPSGVVARRGCQSGSDE
jgi:hypothetical protein